MDAGALLPGEQVQTPDGSETVVLHLQFLNNTAVMHDLTVSDIHSYYVVAGNTPVLVHNCGKGSQWFPDENYSESLVNGRIADQEAFRALPKGTSDLVTQLERNPNMAPRLNPDGTIDRFRGNELNPSQLTHWDDWIGAKIYWNGKPNSQIRIMQHPTTGAIAWFPLKKDGTHNYRSPHHYIW